MPPPNAAAQAGAADITDAVPRKAGGKKKLVVMLVVLLLVLAVAGAAGLMLLKQRAAAQAEDDGETAESAETHAEKVDPKVVPSFVALDMFTVNLADREAERYAQIGITLEMVDSKAGDQIKNYMPAIRSNILMVLSQKTSQDLLDAQGKRKLAAEILRESVRPLGYEIEAPEAAASGAPAARRAAHDDNPSPVRRVHFSNFIIQ